MSAVSYISKSTLRGTIQRSVKGDATGVVPDQKANLSFLVLKKTSKDMTTVSGDELKEDSYSTSSKMLS